MDCDYTSCVWNDSYKGCIKPKGRTCPRPLLEQMKKQQTNADRIRTMSDEELAKEFADCAICLYCDTRKKELPELPESVKREVFDSLLEWLKQPVGE